MEKDLYRYLIEFDFSQKAVLCSQLEHKGSVPRKDYPCMLVPENGRPVGTVGGGRVEHEVIERAKNVMAGDPPVFESFDLTNTDASAEGGICGGSTRILLEPYTVKIQVLWKSMDLLNLREPGVIVVTEFGDGERVSSRRYVITPDSPAQTLPGAVAQQIPSVWESGKSKTLPAPDAFYLIQLIRPLPVLHIFGAGHVGLAVAQQAHLIDLDTVVYDDREDLASAGRFPYARRICVHAFDNLPGKAQLSPHDYVLVATRGHQHDLNLLRWLLPLKVAYVGLLSSKIKWRLLSKTLTEDGCSPEALRSVHAPVGLEIGAETVPEIAVSIISEIIRSIRTADRFTPTDQAASSSENMISR